MLGNKSLKGRKEEEQSAPVSGTDPVKTYRQRVNREGRKN